MGRSVARTIFWLVVAGGLLAPGVAARADQPGPTPPGPTPAGPTPTGLTSPWPQAAALAGIAGERVTFPSRSPFSLVDAKAGGERSPPTTAMATLFLPAAASVDQPVPAVVLLHGASGVLAERELVYGRQLAAMGVAALVIDSFGARRDRATSFIERLLEITETMVLSDAYAGLRYLDARPDVDGDRVVLVGFSYGGMASTYAAFAQVAETLAPGGERFAGHVAYYAPCIAEFEDARATGAPLLMLYGGKDAIVDSGRCAELARALEGGGGRVETIVYPDALHQWDGRFGAPRKIGRNLSPCRFKVARDGTIADAFWPITLADPFSRKMALGLCSKSEGYMIGRDDAVRDRSNADLAAFLEQVFTGPGAPPAGRTARVPPPR